MKATIYIFLCLFLSNLTTAQNWVPLGSGLNGTVHTFTTYNGDLYVGGEFTTAGGITVNRVAKWDGTAWSALGTGVDGTVYELVVFNGELYLAGNFNTAGGIPTNRIAKWDGSTWSTVGTGFNLVAFGGIVHNGSLYICGNFTTAGGETVNRVARWDGTAWSAVGTEIDNGSVRGLTVYNGEIHAGGVFTMAGSNNIAKWDGTNWSAVGTGTNGTIRDALEDYNGELYIGGQFTMAGGIPANWIAKWDGSTWSSLGSGLTGGTEAVVRGLEIFNGELIVGGDFTTAGGIPVENIAKWDGTSWSSLGPGMNDDVVTLHEHNSELYAGGDFTFAGGNPANRIAKWQTCDLPSQPDPISGNTTVCSGSSQTYSISAVSGATSYTWTLPSGWTGSSITTSITATVGANGGNISVTANNSCGSSPAEILEVAVNSTPAQPGTISGSNSVCQGSSQTYSINAVAGATTYTWTLPSGWTGNSILTSITATVGTNSGNISVTANNSCGSSPAEIISVTANSIPEQPGTISGNNSVCQGSIETYSIDDVSGATSYTWTLPFGWSGNSTTTFIDATIGVDDGDIAVTANNSCGSSPEETLGVTVNSTPAQPGTIIGNNVVCQGSSQTYSIDDVSGAASYTWTLPSGWTGNSNTTSIIATVGANSGNISVIANNSCGSSPAQNLAVTVNPVPAQPDTISGNNAVCQDSSQTYSISALGGATSYTWTLPSGWTGSSNTTSITATVGANSGNISVTANNSCGSSTAQTLAVTVNATPAQPDTIIGNNSVCQGSSQTYSIDAVSGATSYTWMLPSGWTGNSILTSITATVGASGGNISITANNSCGNSTAQTLVVTVLNSVPTQPGNISGNNSVCQGSSQTYSIDTVSGATSYTWTLPSGWTGTSTTTSITATVGAGSGNISVTANTSCGSSPAQNVAVTVNPFPAQPDTISGNNTVCQDSSQTYSIDAVDGATSYTWTLPSGWTGSSTTTSIIATVGASSGNISVAADNSCGSSTAQILAVTVNSVPAQPGAITGNIMVQVGQTLNYTISPINDATGYNWSLSGGGTITMGMNTESISINWLTPGNYILSIHATNSCGMSSNQTLNITVSLGTGVNDPDNPHEIKINPNPSKGEFYLTAKGVINKVMYVQICSLSGQLIYSSEHRAGTNNYAELLDPEHVAVGVYIVKIRIDKNEYTTTIALINY